MNLGFSPEDEAFRLRFRAWLKANLPAGWNTPAYPKPLGEEGYQCRREWELLLSREGWAGVSSPKEYGGLGLSVTQEVTYWEEYALAGAPEGINILGHGIVGPTLMLYGTNEQKQRFLPKIVSNEEVWCQGYSEPNAGSDLAALQTRAVREGDHYVLTGQKVWTSFAQHADYCFVLVRTDPEAPRHKGISFLLVNMKSPGITVRPLIQITGEAEFNEVFFDEVRVPLANRVGEENDGWKVAMAAASFERGTLFIYNQVRMQQELRELIEAARSLRRGGRPVLEDPSIRSRFAQLYMESQIMRLNSYRNLTRELRGEAPGPESSATKLFWSEAYQRLLELGADLLGPLSHLGPLEPEAPERGRWIRDHLFSRGLTIAGGTSEIQRNIVAERGLGLPR